MEPSEYDTIARLEDQHWWYAGMREIARAVVRGLPHASASLILDAGCGVGGGLEWLSAFGATVGIDLHPRALHYAAQKSDHVAQASIQALPFPSETFHLVTSFEVLYHLAVTDDLAALQELARVLRPGGWLLVRVPAHDWLRGAHDRQVHTRHRYGPAELKQKIQAAGLQIKRMTSVGLTLLPFAILKRLTDQETTTHSDVTLPPFLINQLLKLMLTTEGLLLRGFNLPIGLSVLALACKNDKVTG
jgi:SAM-dependent methyltransferase